MAGILSGLGNLGLGNLENMELYETAKEAEEQKKAEAAVAKVEEKDFLLDRSFKCPVCDNDFSAKTIKTGKAKLLGTDWNLRPKYEGVDPVKYDVQLCSSCGYAALSRFFPNMTSVQAKLVKENISQKVRLHPFNGETYSYKEALERYQLALVNAVVKRGKASEKAYICLKSSWLVRSYIEELEAADGDAGKIEELKGQEEEYLMNAYNGFVEARQSENFPMCGMDESTMDYLLAELAAHFKKYDVASKLIAGILTSTAANARMKDKARDLKDRVLTELKKRG